MGETGFRAIKVTDRVYWVGAVDWSIRDFHGYTTQRGTTYNAYLVTGERPVLVDTVKAPFFDEMMARIASVVDPGSIRVIISNHSEMDHSGGLPRAIEQVRPDKVYASVMGAKNLRAQNLERGSITTVKDGETVELGDQLYTFLETRMLHWPDSMITYLAGDQLVFSQDGFGMHLALSRLFADENDRAVMHSEAKKYFANILLPYAPLVLKLLERVRELGVPIKVIAPDHGPIWRQDLDVLLGWWRQWAEQRPGNHAVVIYDTMWQSTAMMARAIADGVREGGSGVSVVPLSASSRSDAMTELLGAGALLVGTPTINNGLFPSLADFLAYARGLRPQNLIGAAFGSYGWSGEGTTRAEDCLRDVGVVLVAPALKHRFVPGEEALGRCRDLGKFVAQRLAERAPK